MTKRTLPKKKGESSGILLSAAGFLVIILMIFVVFGVILANSLGVFWQKPFSLWKLSSGESYLGELSDQQPGKIKIKIDNKNYYSQAYLWIEETNIVEVSQPKNAVLVDRWSGGPLIGFLGADSDNPEFPAVEAKMAELSILASAKAKLQGVNNSLNLKLSRNRSSLAEQDLTALKQQITDSDQEISLLQAKIDLITTPFLLPTGEKIDLPLEEVISFVFPNQLSFFQKVWTYAERLWTWLSTYPREANTEGGILPAILGTVMMVFFMSLFSFPLGVVTAIYLSEYAKEGFTLRLIRVAVNNLAGVPSIVYGMFGLGFFIYGVGASVDRAFFADSLPTPTFGTGGILWASITLSLLTAPVVIVATEEALISIPKGMREASLALGASKFQTICRIVFPMAIPGMMTGFILAMARAAGEVAPLMITGVVKYTASLPVDGTFPFLHLDRKFMHLGFHIFDLGFQSPNIEAARAHVFMTTLLLVVLVVILSLYAVVLREKMRSRYFKKSI